jgi:superfamily II DNA or RNA helicase
MSLQAYHDLIASKRVAFAGEGLARVPQLNAKMFPHQAHSTEFALRNGRSALFLDTGLGKSLCALDWGRVVMEETNKPVLMLAPLAVAQQHKREADKFGIDAAVVRSQDEVGAARIYVTNYDRLDKFDASRFAGVILDESSVIKNFTGKTTRALIDTFSKTRFRLACTATPAPNDHTELGTHAEFLGAMRREEMLPIWFINDTMDTGTWRIKGHARENFWSWVASWSRCVSKPSDLGFDDSGFALPPIEIIHHEVAADRLSDAGYEKKGKHQCQQRLFRIPDTSATSIHHEKRLTIEQRADKVASLLSAEPDESWIVWVDTDYEADAVMARLPGAIEVRGSMKVEEKERRLVAFSEGRERVIVTKASIAGFGLNWQHCARQCFAGISFSYENFYQAIRRSWRFGQKRPVNIHVVCADTERAIWAVVERKAGDHEAMKREMVAAMRRSVRAEQSNKIYQPTREASLPIWLAA